VDKVSGRSKRWNKKAKHREREGVKLQYEHGVFHFAFAHHPVPVRSLLNDRSGPDDNVGRESGRSSEMFLGPRFQTEIAAWQTIKHALHPFLHMWCDAALRGRVDGEDAGVRTALHISVHTTGAFVDGLFKDFGFPTIQERGVKFVPGSVTIGEHKRLFGIQSLLCEGVKLSGIPMDLDLDPGKGHRVRRIFTLSVGCEGNMGLVIV